MDAFEKKPRSFAKKRSPFADGCESHRRATIS
jgi:hypothetical protein